MRKSITSFVFRAASQAPDIPGGLACAVNGVSDACTSQMERKGNAHPDRPVQCAAARDGHAADRR
jgi:hypothetical protein